MTRYIDPKSQIARRFGEPIFSVDKTLARKSFPLRQHGSNHHRKVSEYSAQLAERRKAKCTYGVLERQFHNLFDRTAEVGSITDGILLQNLENHLDDVVFRLSIAPTRTAARQLVSHKHIVVDGNVVDITSCQVKAGDAVGVRERTKSFEVIETALAGFNHGKYPWLEQDNSAKCGKLLRRSDRVDIPENIKEQLIIGLYSKQWNLLN